MASNVKEVATEFLPVLRVYKDGTVDRLYPEPQSPPSPLDPATSVSSKDIIISPEVSARLYLPKLASSPNQKLPILVYFHGGAFCVGSVSSSLGHHSLNSLVAEAKVVAVSVGYRLAPEHPLPAAYEDCWAGLQWVASHAVHGTIVSDTKASLLNHENNVETEPWLINHGDFDRIYLGGDSAGANIAHNIAMRAGMERLNRGIKIAGSILSFPYFLGSEPIGSEPRENHKESLLYRFWMLAYSTAPGGIDNPMINPWAPGAPGLAGLGCGRLFVCVGEKDKLRERGVRYCEAVKESGWKGKLEFVEVEGEDHIFHIFRPNSVKAKRLIKRMASFIV